MFRQDTSNNTMYNEIITAKLLECILKYQKKNNTKNQCMANVQYLRDILLIAGASPVVKPTICVGIKNDALMVNTAHLTISLNNDTLIDPSYEFQSIENKMYFHSINEFSKFCKISVFIVNGIEMKIFEMPGFKDKLLEFLKFVESAKKMNNNRCIDTSNKYYNKLADYVEYRMDKWELNPNDIDKSLTSKSVFNVE